MTVGPGGKYEKELTVALGLAEAFQGLLIVVDGRLGPGFSAQLASGAIGNVPNLLRHIADQIEADGIQLGFKGGPDA